jgi:large subunit ribosomal protein L9
MKVLIKKTKQVEEVKDSYAVNYLIPQGLAVMVTDNLAKKLKQEEVENQQDLDEKKKRREQIAQEIEGKTFVLKTKANEEGQLYGSIGQIQVKKALKIKEKIVVKLKEPIKKTGKYTLEIRVGSFKAKIILEVVAW